VLGRASMSSLGGGSNHAGAGLAAARSLGIRRSLGSLPPSEGQAPASSHWASADTPSAPRIPRPKTRRVGLAAAAPAAAPPPPPEALAPALEARHAEGCRRVVEAAAESLSLAPAELQQEDPNALIQEFPSGLTVASLKHLKRQRDALASERERLLAEIARLQALIRDQQAEREADERQREALQREAQEARDPAEARSASQAELAAATAPLEERLRDRGAEIAQLRRALEEERQGIRMACEVAERAGEARARAEMAPLAERAGELEEMVQCLRQEKLALQAEHQRLTEDCDAWRQKAEEAEAAVQSASQTHNHYKREMEKLRPDLVTNAIRSKIELHICVPRVALEYPDAPPMIVDMANGLSREHVRKFLQNKVFPQFDPLWMCLDGVDRAPDGTNKKAYSARILELLTDRLKEFVDEFRGKMEERCDVPIVDDDLCVKGPPGSGGNGGGAGRAKRLVRY